MCTNIARLYLSHTHSLFPPLAPPSLPPALSPLLSFALYIHVYIDLSLRILCQCQGIRQKGGWGRARVPQGRVARTLSPVSSRRSRAVASCDVSVRGAAVTQLVAKGNPRGYGRLATPFRPAARYCTPSYPLIPLHIAAALSIAYTCRSSMNSPRSVFLSTLSRRSSRRRYSSILRDVTLTPSQSFSRMFRRGGVTTHGELVALYPGIIFAQNIAITLPISHRDARIDCFKRSRILFLFCIFVASMMRI